MADITRHSALGTYTMCVPPQAQQAGGPLAPAREINEAVLAAIWNEQAPLRGPMWDCEGNPVAVVYRGRWTGGSGPDFDGAMLAMGEGGARLTGGAVEMHLRCGDWWAHGHDSDPRYNNVALHVVLWPVGARPVTRADGKNVPTLVLADYITLPTAELLEKVMPLLPNLGSISEEPCRRRTAQRSLEEILAVIEAAGDERLRSKADLVIADLEARRYVPAVHGKARQAHKMPPAAPSRVSQYDEAFYRGLMDALGYSANREAMRAVAGALPLAGLLSLPPAPEERDRAALLESVLLGAAGLLPSQRPDLGPLDWLSAEYAEDAEAMWRTHAPILGLPQDEAQASGWTTDRMRPANSPPRRLAAAARLLARFLPEPDGIFAPFLAGLSRLPEEVARRWTTLLMVPADGYWAAHADFGRPLGEGARAREAVAPLGSSRAADIVVNVVIPLLLARAEIEVPGDTSEVPGAEYRAPSGPSPGTQHSVADTASMALAVYGCFPRLAENYITKSMVDEVLGGERRQAIKTARQQQGLIHLYNRYCRERRCHECPLGTA